MLKLNILLGGVFVFILAATAHAGQSKEADIDVNYDESLVGKYELLALIAPQPVYVYSAMGDTWADARGEYLGAYHAGPVYRLLGKTPLESEASPPVGEAIIKNDVGYHVRQGGHSVEPADWIHIMDFMDGHLKVN